MNVSRRRQDDREDELPRGRRDDWDDWDDEPPRRKAPSRQAPGRRAAPRSQRRRSPLVSVALGCYKVLVALSALIVIAYIGLQIISQKPNQFHPDKPPVSGGDPIGGPGGSTSEELPARQRREDVFNILLAATDAGGTRTDTMMVMQYDIAEQKVGVVSVPRDTLMARKEGNPRLVYGPGGVQQRVEDISQILGIPIDYYIKVDVNGFIALVDYLGGIDFYVPRDMNYDDSTPGQDLHIHFKEGMQHLNGQQAMEVARYRHDNDADGTPGPGYSDVGRTQTQQALLVALAKKVLSWGNLTRVTGFVDIFNEYVDTDLSLGNMIYFAEKAMGLDPATGVETATLQGNGFGVYRGYKYCYELDEESTVETVNRLINPYDQPLTLEDMELARAERYHGQ